MNKELQEKHIEPKLPESTLVILVNGESGEMTVVIDGELSWEYLFELPNVLLDHFVKLREQQEAQVER